MIQPELERHIHSDIFAGDLGLAPAQVMDGVLRFPDKLGDPVEAGDRVVGILRR